MKADNQLAFKSAFFTKSGNYAMRKRLAGKEFEATRLKFFNDYKLSKFDITVSTLNDDSKRLTADIKLDGKQICFEKESRWTKFWYTPTHFIEKLSEKIDNLEMAYFGKKSRNMQP